MHKVLLDQSIFLEGQNFTREIELGNANYSFIISSFQSGVITLLVTESIRTQITIFCSQQATVTVRLIITCAQKVDITLSVMLCGQLSKVTIFGMCFLVNNNLVRLKTYQLHCAEKTESRFILHGLITDFGLLDYNGLIRIEKNAFYSYALQNNKNILLSPQASVISVPNIEVLHNNVECYHGSAVGRFAVDQIEYMQSRGLNKRLIQGLLIEALFVPILQGYEKKEFILQKIYEKI